MYEQYHPLGTVGIITGRYGAQALTPLLSRFEALAGRPLRTIEVENRFFGGNTAVVGLLVGTDIIDAITDDAEPPARYLLPDVALSGDRFLDDTTLEQVRARTNVPIIVTPATAGGLIEGAAA